MTNVKILVVEDEAIVAKDIENRLKDLGYDVPAIAFSGEESIKKAAETHPDLVLMDIKLKGGMNGIGAAKRIRARFDIPVVYLTAYADDNTLQRAKITEPYGDILKPFEERELHTAIEIALYKHKMERRLKESEQWLSTTLKSIGDAVVATDTKGLITFMNPIAEILTGWEQKDAVGKDSTEVFNILDEETHNPAESPVAKELQKGVVIGLANYILVTRDGKERPVDVDTAPIKDDKENIMGIVLIFRDITVKREIEEERLKVRKLESLSTLAGGIAQDFSNILMSIFSNISFIKEKISPKAKIFKKLTEAEKASLKAKELTQQLFIFSKGGVPIKETTSIVELIKDSTGSALIDSKVRCEFSIPDDLWLVEVDEEQISQGIKNLITNAVQAMPEGGIIKVWAENISVGVGHSLPLKEGEYVKISIKDQGIGISKKDLQKIFDPYFASEEKGSSLELAVSYSIIKKHNGHIGVKSKIGKGTTFSIYLPTSQEKYDLGRRYLARALKSARRFNNPQWLSQSFSLLAQLKLSSRDFERALTYAEKSISLTPPFSKEYGIGLRTLGRAQSYLGKKREGAENLKKSAKIFRKSGMRYELGISLYESVRAEIDYLSDTRDAPENFSSVLSDFKEAEEIFNCLRAEPFIERIGNLKSKILETRISAKSLLRREYLKVFQKLGKLVNTELEKEDFLEKILDLIIEITNAERGLIFFVAGKKLHLAAGRNIDRATLSDAEKISMSVIEQVKKSNEPLFSFDALSDSRFSASKSVMLHKIRSLLCVPLETSDSVLGTLYLDSRVTTHLFSEEDSVFLALVADLLTALIDKSLIFRRMRDELHLLRSMSFVDKRIDYCMGRSRTIQGVYKLIKEIAPSNATVLLAGETGSGKGVMAQLIHCESERGEGKFVTVNCGTLPETLFESELFGHCKGSFTGAIRDKKGLFEEAEGGTIFFDEVANTSPAIQAKLLQVLEEKIIRKVGEITTRKVDVRVICATNRNLEEEVKQKRFREDLFYRLNVVSLKIPPLRERAIDIPLFADYFIKKYAEELNKNITGVTSKVMEALLTYQWHGNIREFKNTMERAMILAKGPKISIEDIEPRVRRTEKDISSFKKEKEQYEKERIMEALKLCQGSVTKTAKTLGFHRTHLHYLLKKHQINPEDLRKIP